MFKHSIKTNILTIFVILMLVVSSLILYSQYYFNKKLALESTEKLFEHLAIDTSDRLDTTQKKIKNILIQNTNNPYIQDNISFKSNHQALHNLTQIMNINKGIYAMYFATKNGYFYEVADIYGADNLFELYNAPKKTKWTTIVAIDNKTQYSHYDKELNFLTKHTVDKVYSPLNRPWYTAAMKSSIAIRTEPYLFSNLGKLGITYAMELETDGSVLAIDFTMQNLSKILESQKSDDNLNLWNVPYKLDKIII